MCKRYVVLLVFMSGFVFAQEPQAQESTGLGGFLSSIFAPKAAELGKLVAAKKFSDADSYFGRERAYFRENKKDNLETLKALSAGLAIIFDQKIENVVSRIAAAKGSESNNWDQARESITAATELRGDIKKVEIFNEPDLNLKSLELLDVALAIAISEWKEKMPVAFKTYNHSSGKPFFSSYPVEMDEALFFDSNLELIRSLLNTFTDEQLAGFSKAYAKQLVRVSSLQEEIQSRYFRSLMPKDSKPLSLIGIFDVIKKAKEAGFNPKSIPGTQIGFAEITSKTLLKEGQIEFPAQVEMDLPFESTKADIDEIFSAQDKAFPDYLIVFDVAKATASRRILSKADADSKFVTGQTREPNPSYEVARGKLYEAQAGLARAQGTYTQGLAAAIINGIAVGVWQGNVNTAESALRSTSPTLTKDLTAEYKFSTSEVKATRTMTTNYYVIDRIEKKYFKGIFDAAESKTFRISYNIHDKDPERHRILTQYDKEEDIVRFEQAPLTVTASALIDDYMKNRSASKPLPTLAKLRQEMLEDKNKALAHFKAQQFDGKPLKDPRFDSVVVILNPKGALGAGFFIKPTLVLTNYHVVEGVKFIEMKMFNGMETFGKVVKSDVRLDLALIKVQDQGVPVQLFEGNTIDLGSTLEAIGHPKGLTFSITRGIASAVRKKKSVYAVGGKEVLFVQTDAAINPGNSGGPLFLGQKVVGVNNNKLVGGSEGLGFAVHYSEVAEFMKESF